MLVEECVQIDGALLFKSTITTTDDFRDGGNCEPTAQQTGNDVDQQQPGPRPRKEPQIEVIGNQNNCSHSDY